MTTLYILQSQTTDRFYIGVTDDLARRLREHHERQTPSTRGRGPWTLVYTEAYMTRVDALARERQLKAWKSHRAIAQLVSQR